MDTRLKTLNLKAVSVTLPGYGYTSWQSSEFRVHISQKRQTDQESLSTWQPNNFQVYDYAKDIEAVLAADGITGPLLVEGSSYRTAARSRSTVPATSVNVSRICTCTRLRSRTSCVSSLVFRVVI